MILQANYFYYGNVFLDELQGYFENPTWCNVYINTESCGKMESCGQGKDYGEERKLWEKCRVGKDMGLEREVGNYREIELCGKHGIAWRRRKTGKARDNWKDVRAWGKS